MPIKFEGRAIAVLQLANRVDGNAQPVRFVPQNGVFVWLIHVFRACASAGSLINFEAVVETEPQTEAPTPWKTGDACTAWLLYDWCVAT